MKTLTIDNLLYEEVVMLQNILWYVSNTNFNDDLDVDNQIIFADLYDKIMQS
jgi:hypothetical protein